MQDRTTMYSVHPETHKLITHHLSFDITAKHGEDQAARYLKRGFTIEVPNLCEDCGQVFEKKIALEGHKRSHKSEV